MQVICCLVSYIVEHLNVGTIKCFQGSELICICTLWPLCRASFPLNCWLRAALCVHTCACAWVSACVCGSLTVLLAPYWHQNLSITETERAAEVDKYIWY